MSTGKRSATPPESPPSKRFFGSPSTPNSVREGGDEARFEWLDSIGPTSSVLHARYGHPFPSTKVACFDFLGTLIEPISSNKYCQSRDDWRFPEKRKKKKGEKETKSNEEPVIAQKLRELCEEGYSIVIFSSTASFDETFKLVLESFCSRLDVPLHAFFSTTYDVYRKPCVGMWLEYERNWNGGKKINVKESFFVSAAGGLGKLDYGRKFAMNVGIRFRSPQEYFFGEEYDARWSLGGFKPKSYDHSGPLCLPTSTPLVTPPPSEFEDPIAEVVFLVGRPACGKTFLYHRIFETRGYKRITSSNTLEISRQVSSNPSHSLYVLDLALPSRSSRTNLIKLFESISSERSSSSNLPRFRLRCFNFVVPEEVCKHNSQFAELWDRDGGTPEGKEREFVEEEAFTDWRLEFQAPKLDEGFDELNEIYFRFDDQWPTKEKAKERLKNWSKFGDCYKYVAQ
ncbi:uncharacterized protein JCM6883_005492 [Sporobolomyces salmoneus]|uniref:uncharacterized protein n=1 Tax=Sporobolomyces salmoneus TaxID=183962 RepID=UPI0031757A23